MDENAPEIALAALSPSPKRIVLLHTNGPFAGLHQILGQTGELNGKAPSTYEDGITIKPYERRGAASLVSVHRRHILYCEVPLDAEGKHYPVRVK